jgi:hypothetical protein
LKCSVRLRPCGGLQPAATYLNCAGILALVCISEKEWKGKTLISRSVSKYYYLYCCCCCDYCTKTKRSPSSCDGDGGGGATGTCFAPATATRGSEKDRLRFCGRPSAAIAVEPSWRDWHGVVIRPPATEY